MFLRLPDKQFFRPDEVARLFDVSVRTVYYWIEHGKLEATPLGGDGETSGVIRVPHDALKQFCDTRM